MPILGKAGAAASRYFRDGSIWRTSRRIYRRSALTRTTRAALMPVGAATDISALIGRTLARSAGRTINWAGRHPYVATAGGLGAMTAYGIGRGAYDVGRSMVPIAPMNKAAPAGQGPGYNVWGSPRRGPMRSDNIGANGDLVLALHKTRHRT